ncbi:MAG: hypothetical protein WB729_03855 [Candidatus Sulfotelmatobacter sp.]
MLRVVTLLATIALLVPSMLASDARNPEAALDATLHSTVTSYVVDAENLLQALAKFSDDFHVPIGIEWQLSSVPSKPVRFRFEKTTVLQILKDIAAVEPGYALSTANGVVHISRITISDDRRNFLNIPISNFELASEYVFHANNRLRKLVVELANPVSTKNEAGCAGSFGVGAGDQKASFQLRDVAVRDVLDRLLTSAGFNIWLVTFPELPATTTKGFFKSISIFSPNLPDSELPAWDLLLPGYDPVRKQMGIGWKQGPWRGGNGT